MSKGVQKTSVALLNELCQKMKYAITVSQNVNDSGIFECCYVESGQEFKGNGNSKVEAKQAAASLALHHLKDCPQATSHSASVSNGEASNTLDHTNYIGELYEKVKKRGLSPPTFKLYDDHFCEGSMNKFSYRGQGSTNKTAKNEVCRNLIKLLEEDGGEEPQKNPSENHSEDVIHFVSMVEDMGKLKKFEHSYNFLLEKTENGKHQCFLHIVTDPVTVFHGVGFTKNDAKINASSHMFSFFAIKLQNNQEI